MPSRLALVTTALATLVGTVGGVPALTAEGGVVVGTVTAGAPAIPCIQLSSTALDFGTLPFAALGSSSSRLASVGLTNCGTAESKVAAAGTNATGSAGTWVLYPGASCDGTLNRYALSVPALSGQYITTTPTMIIDALPPAEPGGVGFQLSMPCVNSDGAGQTFSFTIQLTATVA